MPPQNFSARPWLEHYPIDVDWSAEIPSGTLDALFDEAVRKWGDRTALRFMGRGWTYAQTADIVSRLAAGLVRAGVRKGDRIGLCMPNMPHYLFAFLAAVRIGAVPFNISVLHTEAELEYKLKDSGAETVFAVNLRDVIDRLGRVRACTAVRRIVVCDFVSALPAGKRAAARAFGLAKAALGRPPRLVRPSSDDVHVRFEHFLAPGPVGDDVPRPAPGDLAMIQYTHGVEGRMKGVMLTHAAVVSNAEQSWLSFSGMRMSSSAPVLLTVIPFFGSPVMIMLIYVVLRYGGRVVLLPRFEPGEVLQAVAREHISVLPGVPMIYRGLLDHPRCGKADLSSLELCISGSMPSPGTLNADWHRRTGIEISEGYNVSEMTGPVCVNPLHGIKKLNSVGLPYPRTEVRISDLDDPARILRAGETGEICVRGPQLMKGYWNNPEGTKAVLTADGFLRTGDAGYMDGQSYLFIVDRVCDIIEDGAGRRIFPRQVEDAVIRHPAVSQVTVAGIEGAVCAWVVLRAGHAPDAAALRDFLTDRLPPHEIPAMFKFRDSLPVNLVGKPDRKALLAEAQGK